MTDFLKQQCERLAEEFSDLDSALESDGFHDGYSFKCGFTAAVPLVQAEALESMRSEMLERHNSQSDYTEKWMKSSLSWMRTCATLHEQITRITTISMDQAKIINYEREKSAKLLEALRTYANPDLYDNEHGESEPEILRILWFDAQKAIKEYKGET